MTDALLLGVTDDRLPGDTLSDDLASLASRLPAIPLDYAELRALLLSLPDPTPPSMRAARAAPQGAGGITDQQAVNQIVSPQQIGQQSGGSIGVYPQLFYGKSNLLTDPYLQLILPINPMTAVAPSMGWAEWTAWYVLNSGTAPTTPQWLMDFPVSDFGNPANSNAGGLFATGFTAACNIDLYVSNIHALQPNTNWSFLLGAIRFLSGEPNIFTNITSATLYVEVVSAWGTGATVLATSEPFDWLAFYNGSASKAMRQLVAVLPSPSIADKYLRVRLNIVASGAGGTVKVNITEPQLTYSTIQTPPPYSPIIGQWEPDHIINFGLMNTSPIKIYGAQGDALPRLEVQGSGQMLWGTGSVARDVRLQRNGAGILLLDANAQANQTALQVQSTAGQANSISELVAGDSVVRSQLRGDATLTGLSFGPGNAALDARLLRSAAKALQLDDAAGGAALLDLNLGNLRLPVGTAALPAVEGDVRWRSDRKLLLGYDATREKALSELGWTPKAYPIGLDTQGGSTTFALPINGGSILVPMMVVGHMLLESLSVVCHDTTLLRTAEWRLYEDRANASATANEIAGANGTFSFTAAAIGTVNSAVAAPPIYLGPGLYWLVLRNTSAANAFDVGVQAPVANSIGGNRVKTKTLAGALAATLDLVTSWTASTSLACFVLNGRVLAQAAIW